MDKPGADDAGSSFAYPSSICDVELTAGKEKFHIRLPMGERFRLDTVFKSNEYAIPTQLVRPGMVIIDVGANVGCFALYAKLHMHRDAVVHCFEPAPASLALLRRNLAPFGGVHFHGVALGDRDGEVALSLHSFNTGQNTLKPVAASEFVGTVDVPLRHAGAFFDKLGLHRIDVLKIDTEGYETEILESLGSRTDNIHCVLAEFHSDDDRRRIDAILRDFVLLTCRSSAVGIGVVSYVRKGLL
jgi:FkbM family methyltransferase